MADYEERMLVLLVEKYRDSKKDTGENRIVRKTRIKPKICTNDIMRTTRISGKSARSTTPRAAAAKGICDIPHERLQQRNRGDLPGGRKD